MNLGMIVRTTSWHRRASGRIEKGRRNEWGRGRGDAGREGGAGWARTRCGLREDARGVEDVEALVLHRCPPEGRGHSRIAECSKSHLLGAHMRNIRYIQPYPMRMARLAYGPYARLAYGHVLRAKCAPSVWACSKSHARASPNPSDGALRRRSQDSAIDTSGGSMPSLGVRHAKTA
jgi:hypothetical protein